MTGARVGAINGRRRAALGLALCVAAAASLDACSAPATGFTGIWKTNCDDFWGVQIRPAAAGLYAVSFCGLSGCLPPGDWTPDTRIEGDPMYQVVSATTIRIRRTDKGYFTYSRCSTNPAWQMKSST